MARALDYLQKNQLREGVIELKNVLQLDPNDVDAHYRLALTALRLGGDENTAAAISELRKVVDAAPNNVGAQTLLGSLHFSRRQIPDARARADAALAVEPRNPEALLLRARLQLADHHPDKALPDLEAAAAAKPADEGIFVATAEAYAMAGDTARAAQTLEAGKARVPGSLILALKSAELMAQSGKQAEADAQLSALRAAHPADRNLQVRVAGVYLDMGRWDQAVRVYQDLARDGAPASVNNLVDFYARTEHMGEAISVLESMLEKTGDTSATSPAREKLIDLNLRARHLEAARADIEKIPAETEDGLARPYFNARLLLAEGRAHEAVATLEPVVLGHPRFTMGQRVLAFAYLATGNINKARRAAIDAAGLNPSEEAQLLLASVELESGTPSHALELTTAVLSQDPRNRQAVTLKGEALMALGNHDEARQVFTTLARAYPKDPTYWYRLAAVDLASPWESSKARETAIAHLEEALAASPRFMPALEKIVALLVESHHAPEARARVAKQIALVPNDARLQVLLGGLWQPADPKEAMAAFRKAIAVDPAAASAYTSLAGMIIAGGTADKAIAEYQSAAARSPTSVAPRLMLGTLYAKRRDLPRAEAAYQSALNIDHKNPVAAAGLAAALADQNKDLDRATQLAYTAAAAWPNDPHTADMLGWIRLKKNDLTTALEILRHAADKLPSSTVVKYHYGVALAASGDRAGAKRTLTECVELGERTPEALAAQKTLETL